MWATVATNPLNPVVFSDFVSQLLSAAVHGLPSERRHDAPSSSTLGASAGTTRALPLHMDTAGKILMRFISTSWRFEVLQVACADVPACEDLFAVAAGAVGKAPTSSASASLPPEFVFKSQWQSSGTACSSPGLLRIPFLFFKENAFVELVEGREGTARLLDSCPDRKLEGMRVVVMLGCGEDAGQGEELVAMSTGCPAAAAGSKCAQALEEGVGVVLIVKQLLLFIAQMYLLPFDAQINRRKLEKKIEKTVRTFLLFGSKNAMRYFQS